MDIFPKQTYTDCQPARGKIINTTNLQRNANQNHNELSPHPCQKGCHQKVCKQQICWGWIEEGSLVHCWWEYKLMQLLWKTVWSFLKKLKIELPYDPANPLLGIYLKKMKTLIWEDMCTPGFIAALSIIDDIWHQPKCPSIDEWIKKVWCIDSVEYILAIKRNDMLPFATVWMDVEGVMLSEISQKQQILCYHSCEI